MKKKYNREVYYYVCSRKGCKFNNQIIKIHEVFRDYLSNLSIDGISKKVLEKQLIKLFTNQTKQNKLDAKQMRTEVSKLRSQLDVMEGNWAIEIDYKKKDILWKNIENTEKRIADIENEIAKHESSMLNLDTYLKYAIDMACNPLKMWDNVELGDKQRLQNLIFPQGIIYNKENSHIEPLVINNFFNVSSCNTCDCEEKEKGFLSQKTKKSYSVLGAGTIPVKQGKIKEYNYLVYQCFTCFWLTLFFLCFDIVLLFSTPLVHPVK